MSKDYIIQLETQIETLESELAEAHQKEDQYLTQIKNLQEYKDRYLGDPINTRLNRLLMYLPRIMIISSFAIPIFLLVL